MLRAVGSSDNSSGGKTRRSGRGAGQGRNAGLPPATNPSFSLVKSLMHGNGANGGTTFTDQIGTQTWNRRLGAGTTVTSTAQVKYGTASILISGSYGLKATASGAFDIGTSDFCLEMWIYPTSSAAAWLFNKASGGAAHNIGMVWDGSNRVQALASRDTTSYQVNITSSAMTLNAWHHIAFTRSSGVWKLYIDGLASATTATDSGNFSNAFNGTCLGDSDSGGAFNSGYIDDFRYTVGSPVYTSNFIPPAAQFPDS